MGVEMVRVLRYTFKKKKKRAKLATKGHLKVILVKTQKKRRAGEKSSNFLEYTNIYEQNTGRKY